MRRSGGLATAEEVPRKRRSLFAVAVATALMAGVLYYLDSISLWIATGTAGAVILVLGLWAQGRRILPRLAVVRGRARQRRLAKSLAIGTVAGAAMVAATHAGFHLLVGPLPVLRPLVDSLYADLQAPPGPVAALPIVALVVLAEEVMWRAVLLDTLRLRLGPRRSLALATAVYSLPQVVAGNPALLAAAVGGGVVWGALYLWRRDLVAPFVCHFLWDVGIFVVWPLV